MALYRTLYPLTYRSGNTVMHVTKPGVIIDLDRNQAQELSGRVVYVGDLITYPRSGVMYYDSVDSFPLEGDERYIFLARQEGELYGWSYSDGYKLLTAAGQVDEEALAEAVGDVIEDALGDALAGKANVSHTHTASSITDGVRTVIVSTGSEARPSTTGTVLWLGGSSEPTNYDDTKDIWFGTD
ncbi:hypothetical protein PBI_REDNO2_42 [Mycobacterium phage Redno2]|uniref:hypothetical protein n=1 Tax=Mycobacterium phage Redno2 TaxID=1340709 RepID=UPI000387A736|nr:hypothetical protein N860_gp042 [Mycobacterium phage Redno2]AGS82341.1 hypothetical protein PBI_REDNO2_42 [Mycobacterium phage Redno2]